MPSDWRPQHMTTAQFVTSADTVTQTLLETGWVPPPTTVYCCSSKTWWALQSHTACGHQTDSWHSPAWMDLVYRFRGQGPVSGKVSNTLHWDLLSMAISQVEPTLKPYDTYLPPMNSHRAQEVPFNNLDEVHEWMQLHRPDATDDRECSNLEFCAL